MTQAATELATLADRYWKFECYESPFAAVLAGEATEDAVLFRESPADFDRKCSTAAEMLVELDAIPADGLAAQDRATHALMRRELQKVCDFHAVGAHLRPSLYPAGPEFNLRYFSNGASANTPAAAELYLERLRSITGFVADLKASLQAGHAKDFRYSAFVLSRAAAAARAGIPDNAEESPLYGPFVRSTSQSQKVRDAGRQALALIEKEITPAFVDYAEFLGNGLAQGARDSIACSDDPLGPEHYDLLARHYTSLDMSPEQVHELGLSEVERVLEEIAAVAAEAGYAGRVREYKDYLSSDPAFIASSPEQAMDTIRSICKSIDLVLPNYFGRLPRITYGVRMIPEEISEHMPPAYAQPSPADNSAPGVFWLTGIARKCPTYFYRSLALHEGWPGHLMQIALMQEQTELPKFRRNGALKYTACIEGWAMYCENLGTEMGIYETPHDHYGRLLGEIWRSVRLVVDTGIHLHNWSREKAVDYMGERVAIPKDTLEAEIDRYIALPGQALAYQPGNLKFRELRQRAEQRLGDDFDVRQFHDTLIAAGPVTLPILDDIIEHWLAEQV